MSILAAEGLLLIWKCNHFFNGDSLYFFSHRLESWSDIWRVFKAPDSLWQYRPLTFVIFTFILNPLFGMHPLGYNVFPLLVHAGNTLIVFGILRMLVLEERAALIGTFFFGTHSVAFYVTYGVAFLPDFSYSFFYLLSVFFFVKFLRSKSRGAMAWSFLTFILALFCKEAAVTLPVLIFALSFLWGEGGFRVPQQSIGGTLNLSLRRTFPHLLLGSIYLGFHWIVKAGQIYAPGTNHPHHAEFSLYSLHLKYKYLKWAFNLPDGLVFRYEGLVNYLIALAVLAFVVPFALATVRHLWIRDRLAWCGSIWFVVSLSPVLFLRNLTMHHNLYVPLVGVALLIGAWLNEVIERLPVWGVVSRKSIVTAFIMVFAAAVFLHNRHAVRDSWIAEASTIAETSLRDLMRLRPAIPDGAILYIIDKSPPPQEGPRWFFDYGSLFRLFYPARSLEVRFLGRDERLPGSLPGPHKAIFLEFDGLHLSEVHGGS